MKVLNKSTLVVIATMNLLISCKPNKEFTEQDVMFSNPFKKIDTVIYVSAVGQKDKIVFFPSQVDTIKYRNFEQGFYDQYVLRVNYMVMPGSYHRFVVVDKFGNPEQFYSSSISDINEKELGFLGLTFDEDALNKLSVNGAIMSFDEKQATYRGVNINEGIKSFKFSSQIGVVSYVDTNNIEWTRDMMRP